MSFRATYFSSGSVIGGGGNHKVHFFRIPSLITAQMAGILWVLFFFGGGGLGGCLFVGAG